MKILAMIPARLGSQRLERKNLRTLDGQPLIVRAIRRCQRAGVFSEIWVNSESTVFAEFAESERVNFHKRPPELGNHLATSEEYIAEFLAAHDCDYMLQVHSIAPLLTVKQIRAFAKDLQTGAYDSLLSFVPEQIECAFMNQPINFSFHRKTNSQELAPIQRISWSITGWKRSVYLDAVRNGLCATYSGRVGFFALDRLAGHVIKTQEDLDIAEALLPLRLKEESDSV